MYLVQLSRGRLKTFEVQHLRGHFITLVRCLESSLMDTVTHCMWARHSRGQLITLFLRERPLKWRLLPFVTIEGPVLCFITGELYCFNHHAVIKVHTLISEAEIWSAATRKVKSKGKVVMCFFFFLTSLSGEKYPWGHWTDPLTQIHNSESINKSHDLLLHRLIMMLESWALLLQFPAELWENELWAG